MTATAMPVRTRPDREGFARLLRAEWTKFRTVRGWIIAMVIAALLTVLIGIYAGLTLAAGIIAVLGSLLAGRLILLSPWAGLGVLAAWTAAALLAGGLVLRLRDA